MTRGEIDAWRRRWKLVNELELEELRSTSVDVKFQQVAALMGAVDFFGWREALADDDQVGYDRWQKLRQAYARREALRS